MARNICEVELPLVFPPTFLWGAATAAHQVQGSPESNWGQWERSPERKKELQDAGKDPNDYISGNACEFEQRFSKDFALARSLGHSANRFSINWATVEPHPGEFDRAILARYRRLVRSARRHGLTPIVTLYHWTHPAWFEAMGSWKCDGAPLLFARFVEEALKYIGDMVHYYTVLNEPTVYGPLSFLIGCWPPKEKNSQEVFLKVMDNLAEAHRRAYALIKQCNPHAEVGIAHAVAWEESSDPNIKAEKLRNNLSWTDTIIAQLDFIGLNVYFHEVHEPEGSAYTRLSWTDPCSADAVVSDFGWGMCSRSLAEVLKEFWHAYKKPLMVTEHGHAVAEMDDRRRCWFLWESLKWVHQAMQEGIDLRGYLHWSLLDNFEWAEGFTKKFGLIHVDRATQKRTPRTSAYLLRDIIKAGGLTQEIAEKYRTAIRHPNEL